MSYDVDYRVRAIVDLDALRLNITNIQKGLKPGTKSCAVIKADAYGHGAVQVAGAIDDLVDFLAVATLDEAVDLRNHGIEKPILILGYVDPRFTEVAVRYQIRMTVFDLEQARAISSEVSKMPEQGGQALIHIKLDTGMGRIGFTPDQESLGLVAEVSKLPGIYIEGIFTHFANADGPTMESTERQFATFRWFIEALAEQGVQIPIRHCANSAAATRFHEADLDMVRLGISIYGLYPSNYVDQIKLAPVISLKSRVVMVKEVPEGFPVGYGSTWVSKRRSRIATIPIGYADGYCRSLSNKGYVLINGAKYMVIGRVCMDQIMVDVTEPMAGRPDTPVQQGDEVVLIGSSGDQTITVEEIADLAGSFNYEFVCGLAARVPRVYIRQS